MKIAQCMHGLSMTLLLEALDARAGSRYTLEWGTEANRGA